MTEQDTGQTKYEVILFKSGPNKIELMKIVMSITKWGLKQSKDAIDNAPSTFLESVDYETAAKAVNALQDAGAEAELQKIYDFKW